MFKVYFTEQLEDAQSVVFSVDFAQSQLSQALAFCEMLRKDRREGREVSFITMVGEDADCVGEAGVGETGPEYKYQWYKRREPPPGEING